MDDATYQEKSKLTNAVPGDAQYLMIGLAEEVGEVARLHTRFMRGKPLSAGDLKEELGDVLWYLTQLASHYNMTLAELKEYNIDKLEGRHGCLPCMSHEGLCSPCTWAKVMQEEDY